MMKVLVTGGSGFIGRSLAQQLPEEFTVSAPLSGELDLLDATSVADYLAAHRFDAIIHTATWNATKNSTKDVSLVLENNLRMFFNLVRCQGSYGKMVYYGSGAEFCRQHWVPRMAESYFDGHVPVDQYGYSKYVMTKYALTTDNIHNLRLFGVFGKHEDWEIRFISNACCKAVFDLPITIRQNVLFDYLDIDDLVEITKWFLAHDTPDKTYNICSGRTYSLRELAEKVLKASGKDLEIIVSKPGMGTEYSGDNSRIVSLLPDFRFRDMDASIRRLYDWYDKNQGIIRKEALYMDK